MTDLEQNTYLITTEDYFDMLWTFADHNSRDQKFKAGALRTVCTCADCEMVRRVIQDDLHVWPAMIPVFAAREEGADREEWREELKRAMQELGFD